MSCQATKAQPASPFHRDRQHRGSKPTVACGGQRSLWHKPSQRLPAGQPWRGPGGSADSQGHARVPGGGMRAALTCALMSWGCSGGEGRKNKASAQQKDSSPVPHPPAPRGLGATWHCRAVLRKPPAFPQAAAQRHGHSHQPGWATRTPAPQRRRGAANEERAELPLPSLLPTAAATGSGGPQGPGQPHGLHHC